jgi:hypothetical protein
MELYPRGRNSANYPSIEEIDRLTKMTTNPLFINIIDEEWNVGDEGIYGEPNIIL